ncbi:MAG: type III-A CRISPR-associated protein Csm2 [Candidatus Desulfofervidus auxilii]|nr:type III-A CRISPR-associated protein Csm2 [Candidatus Desulfofervidus auxilii]
MKEESKKKKGFKEIEERLRELHSFKELDYKEFCDEGGLADKIVQNAKELKMTQLRKFFNEIKAISRKISRKPNDPFDFAQVAKLLPVLVYSVGRGLIPKEFYQKVLKICLRKEILQTNEDFLRLADFLEAIIAYHKYHYPRGG